MIHRRLAEKTQEALRRSPSVALLGPRQVGKTTLALSIAKRVASVYLDLESHLDLQKVQDLYAFHAENRKKLIILDEVHRLPEVFKTIRGIIDRERREENSAGQFLFLGSASMALMRQSSESLAGRIATLELHPVDVLEYARQSPDSLSTHWLRGGFPESLLARSSQDSLAWRQDFIRTYLERDIPQLGPRIPAETLHRLWMMLAHNQGTTLNAAHLARNLDVSGVTIGRYLDLMVDLLLVRRLMPWTFNVGKRLVRSPKVYLRDSGIAHALLNVQGPNDLLGHPVVGGSWEGFVIENLLSVTPAHVQPFYYRTSGGAELDLILEFGVNDRWAIEIKRNSTPTLSRGFYTACDDIQASKRLVVYSGKDSFPLGKNVTALSLPDLMDALGKQ